jgi:hypothetical protein
VEIVGVDEGAVDVEEHGARGAALAFSSGFGFGHGLTTPGQAAVSRRRTLSAFSAVGSSPEGGNKKRGHLAPLENESPVVPGFPYWRLALGAAAAHAFAAPKPVPKAPDGLVVVLHLLSPF